MALPQSANVALCIGHSRKIAGRIEGGAVSVGKVNEHTYNLDLAKRIQRWLSDFDIDSFLVSEYEGNGYTAAQKWLAGQLKAKGATLAIELHFNSADYPTATGHEWLFWASSSKGRLLAKELDAMMLQMFPDFRQRGIKPIGGDERGGAFLRLTHCPAVISEPFFGSNSKDWSEIAVAKKEDLAQAIALGIRHYVAQV
jgi:N-acetylmuramoyl-L-alanine amidase